MTQQVFVARERELVQLNDFLDRAIAGHGQVVFVTGEAGAGKTALVTEFARRAQDTHDDILVAIGNCNSQTGIGDPFLPFREVLGLLTGDVESKLAQGAITQENANRLQDFLRTSGQALVDLGPDLIDIFVPGVGLATRAGTFLAGKAGWLDRLEDLTEREAAGGMAPDQNRIFEQYTDVLRALAAQQPLLVVLDDLHWSDASSIELLFHLGRRIREARILMAGTYRPEDVALGRAGSSTSPDEIPGQPKQHPLDRVASEFKRYYGDIWVHLGRADETANRRFVDALLDTEPNRLGEAFRQALFRHTRGHPLFTSELLRDMQERGDLVQDEKGRWCEGPDLGWSELPAKVEGVIETRIGRLEEALREVLTVASVEGEDFTAEVVARVQATEVRALVRRLSGELEKRHHLVGALGFRQLGAQRLSLYRFRHNLFQKYLYNSLDEVERAYLHEDVGNILEVLYAGQTGEIAVQLARHFRAAGVAEKAIDYSHKAAERASRSHAHQDAVEHFTQALALLEAFPETPERAQTELTIQMGLGKSLMIAKGAPTPEVGQTFARARELCELIGDAPEIFSTLHGLSTFHFTRGEYEAARELAQQSLQLAEQEPDPDPQVEAHRTLGLSLTLMGQFVPARAHLEKAIVVYDRLQVHPPTPILDFDPGVSAKANVTWSTWCLGYPDQAREQGDEALMLAEALSHPPTLAYSFLYVTMLQQLLQDETITLELAERLIALCTERRIIPMWVAFATMLKGWGFMGQGRREEGIAQILQGLASYRAMIGRVALTGFLVMLAEAYLKAGQAEEGLAMTDDVLARAHHSKELMWEAEIHRLRGELLLARFPSVDGQSEAEACFSQAIEVARKQQAKSWELRATISLCRLWQQQGKREEARATLAEIFGWFTEGFGTPDLIQAKTLLEELSSENSYSPPDCVT